MAEFFTRGTAGAPDKRGDALVSVAAVWLVRSKMAESGLSFYFLKRLDTLNPEKAENFANEARTSLRLRSACLVR